MHWAPQTLKELRKAVDDAIAAMGEDAPVGRQQRCEAGGQWVDDKGNAHVASSAIEYIDSYAFLHWVCIDPLGTIVGTEADDYEQQLKPGERNAIAIL
jgi:hypothetical protein